MKNKYANKTTETFDFKGFNLFVVYSIQKINEFLKDRKLKVTFGQQAVDLFTQQAVTLITTAKNK